MNDQTHDARGLLALTKRQRRVAKLACRGFSNRQIAKKLSVAEGTVKIHLHAIYKKLGIHSRMELDRFGKPQQMKAYQDESDAVGRRLPEMG